MVKNAAMWRSGSPFLQAFCFAFYVILNLPHSYSLSISNPPPLGAVLGLQHKDFSTLFASNATFPQRFQSAVQRSKARKERLERMVEQLSLDTFNNYPNYKQADDSSNHSSGAHGGDASNSSSAAGNGFRASIVAGDGAFLTSFYIGTPPTKVTAIMDTGSDLVWQQCEPCEACFKQPDAIFDPSRSSTYRSCACSDKMCEALLSNKCLQNNASCQYIYVYGDTSYTSGGLAYDTLTLNDAWGTARKIENFAFGCGHANQGAASFADSDGLLGMGQGPLSLASQLSAQTFSYCLGSLMSSQISPLFLGDAATSSDDAEKGSSIQMTPFITNSYLPTFYYLNLSGISVNGARLRIPSQTFAIRANGTGGMIIDSGTTITYLEESGYQIVLKAMQSKLVNLLKISRPIFGLDLCYISVKEDALPTLTFHFDGANVDIPPANLFVKIGGLYCLALSKSHGISILGNMQQQNYHILYDRRNHQISFTYTTCDQLPPHTNLSGNTSIMPSVERKG